MLILIYLCVIFKYRKDNGEKLIIGKMGMGWLSLVKFSGFWYLEIFCYILGKFIRRVVRIFSWEYMGGFLYFGAVFLVFQDKRQNISLRRSIMLILKRGIFEKLERFVLLVRFLIFLIFVVFYRLGLQFFIFFYINFWQKKIG